MFCYQTVDWQFYCASYIVYLFKKTVFMTFTTNTFKHVKFAFSISVFQALKTEVFMESKLWTSQSSMICSCGCVNTLLQCYLLSVLMELWREKTVLLLIGMSDVSNKFSETVSQDLCFSRDRFLYTSHWHSFSHFQRNSDGAGVQKGTDSVLFDLALSASFVRDIFHVRLLLRCYVWYDFTQKHDGKQQKSNQVSMLF